MMDLIRDQFVNGDLSSLDQDGSGIKLVSAEEFGYVMKLKSQVFQSSPI